MDHETKNTAPTAPASPTTDATAPLHPPACEAPMHPLDAFAPSESEVAYQATREERDALRDDDLAPTNTDMRTVVTTGYGSMPKVVSWLGSIRTNAPLSDVARIERMPIYLQALVHAQGRFETAGKPSVALAEPYARGMTVRDTLLADAQRLAARGLLDGSRLAGVTNTTGYRNVAFALNALATILRETWPAVEHRCAITKAEVDEASTLAATLMRGVGEREQAPAVIAEASLVRARAFTLFARSYDEARRAIAYIRWNEDDLEEIVPSLYAGRGGSKRKATADEAPTAATSPSDPASVPASSVAPATVAASSLFGPAPVPAGASSAAPR